MQHEFVDKNLNNRRWRIRKNKSNNIRIPYSNPLLIMRSLKEPDRTSMIEYMTNVLCIGVGTAGRKAVQDSELPECSETPTLKPSFKSKYLVFMCGSDERFTGGRKHS